MSTVMRHYYWERSDLCYQDGVLMFGGCNVEALARSAARPLFVYQALRVRDNLLRLIDALRDHELDFRIFYAVKSNRFIPLLTYMRALGLCGVDVCSPRELLLCRQLGFEEQEISFTGTSISDEDLAVLHRHPHVWVNCDSISMIRRLGDTCPGREIGLRVNPEMGMGYRGNPILQYAGDMATKFGIYKSRFKEALECARVHGLRVVGVHFHCGCGYLTPQLPVWERVLETCTEFLDQVRDVRYVNVGGGLGIPLVEGDSPLDLAAWAGALARHLGREGLQVWVEPGDYIAKDAGILVLRVNEVEEKGRTIFVAVNGGFNLHMEPVFYRLPLEVVPCRVSGGHELIRATIAGNINEALDVWAEGVAIPQVKEGDFLALLNAGGYGSSMSSDHCLRGDFAEYLILHPRAS